ncbi:MAG: hypothetical protein R3C03_08125 [Pirellulaceae bacterium]
MNEKETLDDPNYLPLYSQICHRCIHLVNDEERRCRAFPDGIPKEIWIGENDHTQPVPGDGGILFVNRIS